MLLSTRLLKKRASYARKGRKLCSRQDILIALITELRQRFRARRIRAMVWRAHIREADLDVLAGGIYRKQQAFVGIHFELSDRLSLCEDKRSFMF